LRPGNSRSVCRQERWNLQDVDGLRHIGALRGIVHVGQYGHAK
jgi:hypothetical protein